MLQRRSLAMGAALALVVPFAFGQADKFPNRPLRIVVPFGAGSSSDANARFLAEKLAASLGQAVYVENKPGASGAIGLQYTKGLPADGYTIVQTSISPMTVNPIVMKDLPYDPVKDFKPLYGMTRGMNVIVVANDSRLKTFADLVAAGKAGKPLSVGTFSAGYYIAAEWLGTEAGIKIANIPYKGQSLIMTDVMGKQLDFALVDLGGAAPLITSGRIRALAVSGETRHPDFPNVPAVKETYPNYVQYSWNSFYVRTQTPDDIAAVLAQELRAAMATQEGKDLLKSTGMEYVALPPAEMQRFARDELDRFKRIAKTAGIQPE